MIGDRALPSSLAYAEVRPLLRWVYTWMFLGLLVTAATAFLTAGNPVLLALRAQSGVVVGSVIAQFVLVIVLSWAITRIPPSVAAVLFMLYAALTGFVFSILFIYYRVGSIAGAFITTSLLFAIMSVIGYTTNTDLTRFRGYLMMALIGLVVAMIVNIFLQSSQLEFLVSAVGVLLFTALTAYDTQKLKRLAANPAMQADGSMVARMSIFGALTLYLDFINLFLFLLRLSGGRRR